MKIEAERADYLRTTYLILDEVHIRRGILLSSGVVPL